MIVVCQHTSTDTFWGQSSDGRCEPFIEQFTRTTLHSDQQLAIIGGMADGFGGGFASVAGQEGVWLLVVTVVALKVVLRIVR